MARRGDEFQGSLYYISCTASVWPSNGPFLSEPYRVEREWPGMIPEYPATPMPFRWGPHGSLWLLLAMLGAYGVVVALILGVIYGLS